MHMYDTGTFTSQATFDQNNYLYTTQQLGLGLAYSYKPGDDCTYIGCLGLLPSVFVSLGFMSKHEPRTSKVGLGFAAIPTILQS